MADKGSASGHDAPITSPDEDYFGADSVALAIDRAIRNTPDGWSTRIGLYGAWGSGKTSTLNLLKRYQQEQGFIIIELSAWPAVGETGVLQLIHEELYKELQARKIKAPFRSRAKQAIKWPAKILPWLNMATEAAGTISPKAANLISEIATRAFSQFRVSRDDLTQLKRALGDVRITILIDDLDRADPRVLPKTLLALRDVLDWPGFTYVLAFDRDIIAGALSDYSTSFGINAQPFLQKVIDIAFQIPEPSQAQKAAYATQVLKAAAPFVTSEQVEAASPYLPNEPRRLKSIARSLGLIKDAAARHAPGELDWYALLLYAIVKDADRRLAEWVVERAVSGNPYEDIFTSANKKESFEDVASRQLNAFVEAAGGLQLSDEARRCTLTLLGHWKYEVGNAISGAIALFDRSPPFTRLEVERFVEGWEISRSRDSYLAKEMSSASKRAQISNQLAAQAFISMLVESYGRALHEMAEADTEAARGVLCKKADDRLKILEFLWSVRTGDLASVTAEPSTTLMLFKEFATWLSWSRNPGEGDLRAREWTLSVIAAGKCSDARAVYESTDPYGRSSHSLSKDEAILRRKWRHDLRQQVVEAVGSMYLDKFLRPEGLDQIASGEDHLGAWLVESPSSPLYQDCALQQNLLAMLAESLERPSIRHVVAANARRYLEILLFKTRNASWGGPDKLPRIDQAIPKLVPTLWRIIQSEPVPFRMASSLVELRSDLIQAGISPDAIAEPQWLQELRDRLNKLHEGERSSEPSVDV